MHHLILIVIVIILTFLLTFKVMKSRQAARDVKCAQMQKLWADHIMYTRLVMTGIVDKGVRDWSGQINGVANKDLYVARLMQNQSDISMMFGNDAAAVQSLLAEHIQLAAAVISDVISHDATAAAQLIIDMARLYDNANKIGLYLNTKLGATGMTDHMKAHIDTLIAMVNDYVGKKNDVASTDAYIAAGMAMATDISQMF
jgi:hypothetical protein